MGKQASFAEILREKQGFSTQKQDFNPLFTSEPAHLAYLLGQISPLKKTTPSKTYPHKPYIPKPHPLNERQLMAFAFFRTYHSDFSEAFSLKDLKTLFRKLALKLHPDHNNGLLEPFRELKAHFDILKTVVLKS